VLSQKGRFGACGAPFDCKVQSFATSVDNGTVEGTVTFTTFTTGLRESEREVLAKAVRIDGRQQQKWVLLVAGTTRQRFARQQPVLRKVIDSFEAVPAPATRLRSSQKERRIFGYRWFVRLTDAQYTPKNMMQREVFEQIHSLESSPNESSLQ
jgi:hypothetical protein